MRSPPISATASSPNPGHPATAVHSPAVVAAANIPNKGPLRPVQATTAPRGKPPPGSASPGPPSIGSTLLESTLVVNGGSVAPTRPSTAAIRARRAANFSDLDSPTND
ncbi:hypothetical protein IU486_31590 [Streptomyces gardneri]|uniref:hypothetical protein n=1 Tax=Nocardia TaxID=1817 RepID=UPI00135A1CEB|nr:MULTISPECIES: hypothetical protein [Nocardia]MBF6169244.1 hypothetical protein [Streptomyces gardneri]MBF6208747.1 hypothetical protein [Streptomyces gardneri]